MVKEQVFAQTFQIGEKTTAGARELARLLPQLPNLIPHRMQGQGSQVQGQPYIG